MGVLVWSDEQMGLGRQDMDDTHREMVDLINRVAEAGKETFAERFGELVAHTHQHFAHELELMQTSGDPAQKEHEHQHAKLLGELAAMQARVNRGQFTMARAFVAERLPEWLQLHAASMDSMLAAHLKNSEKA